MGDSFSFFKKHLLTFWKIFFFTLFAAIIKQYFFQIIFLSYVFSNLINFKVFAELSSTGLLHKMLTTIYTKFKLLSLYRYLLLKLFNIRTKFDFYKT